MTEDDDMVSINRDELHILFSSIAASVGLILRTNVANPMSYIVMIWPDNSDEAKNTALIGNVMPERLAAKLAQQAQRTAQRGPTDTIEVLNKGTVQ